MIEKLVQIVAIVIAAAVILFIFLGILPRVDRALNIRAVEVCGNISRYVKENSSEAFTAQYPVAELYEKCVADTR